MKITSNNANQFLFFIAYQVLTISSFYFYGFGLLRFAKIMTPDVNTDDNNVYLLMILSAVFVLWVIVFGFLIQTITGGLIALLVVVMRHIQDKSLRKLSKATMYAACFGFAGQTLLEAGKYFNFNLTLHILSVLAILIGFVYLLFFVYHFENSQLALHRFYSKLFHMKENTEK